MATHLRFLLAAVTFVPIGIAQASVFEVTRAVDTDNTCRPRSCSLREAITAANENPGFDEVSIPAGTYHLTLGPLTVLEGATITGADARTTIVDGNGASRVFEIQSAGAVEISGLTIENGYDALRGGGVYNTADLTLLNSTVSGNRAVERGGGVFNAGGTLTLTNTTLSGNRAGYGAGLHNDSGAVYLSNSTISGNDATMPAVQPFPEDSVGSGGAIFNRDALSISNSTIVDNYAVEWAGGIYNSGGSVTLSHAIVFDNVSIRYDSNCSDTINAPIRSSGHNLMEASRPCGAPGDQDWVVTDALIGPLADNGGPTQTHALLPGSAAIDRGSDACPPPATDQRGGVRPIDGHGDGVARCDIGSVEYLPEPDARIAVASGILLLGALCGGGRTLRSRLSPSRR